MFENNKLTSAAVAVSFSKTEEVTKFLLERYQPLAEDKENFYFINNDIKKTDMAVILSVQDAYLLIMYIPYEATTKAVNSSDKRSRLKALFKEARVKSTRTLPIAIKSPYTTSQLHTDQTNNKLYLYEKTNTTNKFFSDRSRTLGLLFPCLRIYNKGLEENVCGTPFFITFFSFKKIPI